jgi:hypothetical protein
MILRRFALILIVGSFLCSTGRAQEAPPNGSANAPSAEHPRDFSEVVVPITSAKISPSVALGLTGRPGPKLNLDAKFGTGFCLDPACRFIGTNYHVAALMPVHKIKGERIFRRYLATGPQEKDATWNRTENGELVPYAMNRDLAIYELRHPLPHHHGLSFGLEELDFGQEVDIYGYPKGIINPVRKLTRFPAKFRGQTKSGLLAFDYDLSTSRTSRMGGSSGGIVVDRKTEKILAILNATTETMALAVPAQTLVDFVSKVQPFLAQRIFADAIDVSPVSADIYPQFAPPPDHNSKFVPVHSGGLQHRPEEPEEVKFLRVNAQSLADSIVDLIAVQSFEWGSGNKEPAALAEYEVKVIDGNQKFREYPDGNKDLDQIPFPPLNAWMLGADEWFTLPWLVGTELRLKVRQASDVVVNGRQIKVFQYYANAEDNMCPFAPVLDFGFFKISKVVSVACSGEVWADRDMNVIRISENLELSDKLKDYRGWEECQIVVTYGWLTLEDKSSRLVPLTIYAEGRYKRKSVYWCRGEFTNYRVFTSRAKVGAATVVN